MGVKQLSSFKKTKKTAKSLISPVWFVFFQTRRIETATWHQCKYTIKERKLWQATQRVYQLLSVRMLPAAGKQNHLVRLLQKQKLSETLTSWQFLSHLLLITQLLNWLIVLFRSCFRSQLSWFQPPVDFKHLSFWGKKRILRRRVKVASNETLPAVWAEYLNSSEVIRKLLDYIFIRLFYSVWFRWFFLFVLSQKHVPRFNFECSVFPISKCGRVFSNVHYLI